MSAADLDLIETALKEAGMLCGWTMPAVRGPAGELWPDHMAQSTPFTEYINAEALAALARVRARQERAEGLARMILDELETVPDGVDGDMLDLYDVDVFDRFRTDARDYFACAALSAPDPPGKENAE